MKVRVREWEGETERGGGKHNTANAADLLSGCKIGHADGQK